MVVSNIYYFHPYLGKIPILTNIFQMGLKPPTRKVVCLENAILFGQKISQATFLAAGSLTVKKNIFLVLGEGFKDSQNVFWKLGSW